jgi:uncharacterized protein (DUF488 family)
VYAEIRFRSKVGWRPIVWNHEGVKSVTKPTSPSRPWCEAREQTIFTVGYQRLSVQELIDLLASNGVTKLVDVRYTPWSRKPGFSASRLEAALGDAGVAYEHWKALGNPPEIRDIYKAGEIEEGRSQFRARLRNGQSDAVDRLVELAESQPVAILCLEADHHSCHRDVVAEEVSRRSARCVSVTHL